MCWRERESRWLTNRTLPEHFDLAVPLPPGFILLLELALLLLGLVHAPPLCTREKPLRAPSHLSTPTHLDAYSHITTA
jgi:hypothetical protein